MFYVERGCGCGGPPAPPPAPGVGFGFGTGNRIRGRWNPTKTGTHPETHAAEPDKTYYKAFAQRTPIFGPNSLIINIDLTLK